MLTNFTSTGVNSAFVGDYFQVRIDTHLRFWWVFKMAPGLLLWIESKFTTVLILKIKSSCFSLVPKLQCFVTKEPTASGLSILNVGHIKLWMQLSLHVEPDSTLPVTDWGVRNPETMNMQHNQNHRNYPSTDILLLIFQKRHEPPPTSSSPPAQIHCHINMHKRHVWRKG